MKKIPTILWPALASVVILALIAAVPGPPSTDFTRGFMRTTNQAEAQTYLGVSGGGGGSSNAATTWIPNTALSYVGGGTNVAIDGSGGTNFYLTVTKATHMTTPSNIPASASTNTVFTVFFKMDGTGTWDVTWTNNFKFPGGPNAVFKPTTNANAVSWVSFTMSPFTNGVFMADYGVYDNR